MKFRLPLVALLLWMSPWLGSVMSQRTISEDEIMKNIGEPLKKQLTQNFTKAMSSDCDAGKTETMNHQLWLYTNYRGLWEYRMKHHFYDIIDKEDMKDSPDNAGSVVFLNYQDTSAHLNCPCGEEASWKMYGRGSEAFNKDDRTTTKRPFRFRAPAQRFYYRTYSCKVGQYIHYFNVFTRPLAITSTPPLMFTEKIPGPSNSINKVTCDLSMYKRIKEKPARFHYIASPFQFYWQFPIRGEVHSTDRVHLSRPPFDNGKDDNLFWDVQPLRTGTIPAHLPDPNFLILRNMSLTPREKICEIKDSPLPSDPNPSVLLGTELVLPPSGARPEHGGFYACIVVDGNGLSSAFWWDGDEPPHEPFRGFTYIRVRAIFYVILAISVAFGLSILVLLMIFFLPDNKEDFTFDTPSEPEPVSTDAPPAKAATSTKSIPGSAVTAAGTEGGHEDEPHGGTVEEHNEVHVSKSKPGKKH